MEKFQEARDKHLAKLDEVYQELRRIMSMPDFCNELYRPYKEAVEALMHRCQKIIRLNNAQVESKEE